MLGEHLLTYLEPCNLVYLAKPIAWYRREAKLPSTYNLSCLAKKSVFNVKFMISCMYIFLGCDGTRVVYSVFSSNFVSNVLVMCLRSLMG